MIMKCQVPGYTKHCHLILFYVFSTHPLACISEKTRLGSQWMGHWVMGQLQVLDPPQDPLATTRLQRLLLRPGLLSSLDTQVPPHFCSVTCLLLFLSPYFNGCVLTTLLAVACEDKVNMYRGIIPLP